MNQTVLETGVTWEDYATLYPDMDADEKQCHLNGVSYFIDCEIRTRSDQPLFFKKDNSDNALMVGLKGYLIVPKEYAQRDCRTCEYISEDWHCLIDGCTNHDQYRPAEFKQLTRKE